MRKAFSVFVTLGFVLVIENTHARAESFLEIVFRMFGIAATPSATKGDQDQLRTGGVIWINRLRDMSRQKLTSESGYHSPVFSVDDNSLITLKENHVIRIWFNGNPPETLQTVMDIEKLIGFVDKQGNTLLVLRGAKNRGYTPALLNLRDGRLVEMTYDNTSLREQQMMSYLLGQDRRYSNLTVSVDDKVKESLTGKIQ